jgi:hypothetical protein
MVQLLLLLLSCSTASTASCSTASLLNQTEPCDRIELLLVQLSILLLELLLVPCNDCFSLNRFFLACLFLVESNEWFQLLNRLLLLESIASIEWLLVESALASSTTSCSIACSFTCRPKRLNELTLAQNSLYVIQAWNS